MGLLDDYLRAETILPSGGLEGTFNDETVQAAVGDSFKHNAYSMTPNLDTNPRTDVRSVLQDVLVKHRSKSNEWSYRRTFNPRGGATPPDDGFLWAAGLGLETIGGGSVTYSYQKARPSFWSSIVGGEPNAVAMEKIVGALVEETIITLAQGEEPMVESSGIAARHFLAGQAAIAAGGAAANATQPVAAGDALFLEPGTSVEVVGVQTDLLVVSRSISGDTVTFDQAITTTGGEVIRPYTPWSDASANQGGDPISSYEGTYTLNGIARGLVGATINIKNNWQEKRVLGSQTFTDANPGKQEVTGTLTFDASESDMRLLHQARQVPEATPGAINPIAVAFTLGNATTGQVLLTMPKVVLLQTKIDVGDSGIATFELPFRALSTLVSGVPQGDAFSSVWS